jgi:hypothetical protein
MSTALSWGVLASRGKAFNAPFGQRYDGYLVSAVKAGAGASGRRREVGSPDSKAASLCRAFATATGGGEGAVGDKSIRRIWRKTASRDITGSGSRRLPRTRCKGRPGGGRPASGEAAGGATAHGDEAERGAPKSGGQPQDIEWRGV